MMSAFIQVMTNGSNIAGLWDFACSDADSVIFEDKILSNDIYAILCAYGVEAARASILREIGGVFAVYNIDVNIRHLELIADYMVRKCFGAWYYLFIPPRSRRPLKVATSHLTVKVSPRTPRHCLKHRMKRLRRSCPMPPCTVISMTWHRHPVTLWWVDSIWQELEFSMLLFRLILAEINYRHVWWCIFGIVEDGPPTVA